MSRATERFGQSSEQKSAKSRKNMQLDKKLFVH